MRRQTQPWAPGDVFTIQQTDGVCTIGQVLSQIMKNVVSCAFYDIRVPCDAANPPYDLSDDRVIAALSVTKEQLEYGAWRVVGRQAVALPLQAWPNEDCRANDWVGARILDAAIAEDLLNAYNGLLPWDDWKDPEYLDKLLVNPDRKPKHLLYRRRSN